MQKDVFKIDDPVTWIIYVDRMNIPCKGLVTDAVPYKGKVQTVHVQGVTAFEGAPIKSVLFSDDIRLKHATLKTEL